MQKIKDFKEKHPYLFWELIGIFLFLIYIIYAASTSIDKVNGALGGIAVLEMMIAPIVVAIRRRNIPTAKKDKEEVNLTKEEAKLKKEQDKIAQKELDAKWNKVIKNVFEVNKEESIIKLNSRTYNFKDILDAELLEDGNSIIKSSLLGTAAKGFLFGVPGLLSKSKKTQNMCNKLEIKITIKDLNNPVEYIKLIKYSIPKTGFVYKSIYEQAQKCISIINIIMEQEKENK